MGPEKPNGRSVIWALKSPAFQGPGGSYLRLRGTGLGGSGFCSEKLLGAIVTQPV
jgi:hypothetical protein